MTDWDKRFEAGVGELAPNLLQDLLSTSPLEHIGPYRLETEVGRGGMGIVYRAQRDDGQFEQQVAIKLLPNPAPSAEDIRRFARERQILANLNHPNIARLFDGGVAEDGRLYLVMELIEGEPLTAYLARCNPGRPQRLALFAQIVAAVAYAQQQLIVHCDLKPSNIMVTASGEAKLLDFGVARVLEQSLGADTATAEQVTTTFGYQPLTPGYAAPEHLDARPLGMYTDVYQLGLILFRLLTDQDYREASSATPIELSQEILHADQQRIEALRGTIDSDLLAVLLKATALDPQTRYAGAAALLADIDRFQNGYPVNAHLPSRWHRLKKLIARRPATAIAVATIGAASIAFVALLLVQERRVSAQRAVAVQQAQSAESVVAYLEGLLDAVAGERGQKGRDTTVYEMLLKSEADLPNRFVDQPIVEERLHRQHATSFYLLRDLEKAINNAQAAIRAFAAAPPDAIAQQALAENHYIMGMAQVILGQREEGLRNHQRAIAIVKASDAPDPEYLAELQLELGTHYLLGQRDPTRALPHIQASVAFFENQLADAPQEDSVQDYVYVLRQRAVAYLLNQQFSLALADFDTATQRTEQHWGKIDNTDVLMREKGRALALLGRFDEARSILVPAHIEITTNNDPNLHASIQMLLGQTELLAGNVERAVELLEQSLAGWIAHYGADMVAVPSTQYLLAQAKVAAGDRSGARQAAEQVLARGLAQFGEQDVRIADFRILMGELQADANLRLMQYQQAQALREQHLPSEDWRLSEISALLLLTGFEVTPVADQYDSLKAQVAPLLTALRASEAIAAQQRAMQLQQRLEQLRP